MRHAIPVHRLSSPLPSPLPSPLAGLLAGLLALALSGAALACPDAPRAEAERMTALINADRAARNLAPLRHDPQLAALAQAHACDMARNGFFSHTGSGGVSFMQRVRAAGGLRGCVMSENIAMGVRSSDAAHRLWMDSSGHRANILRADNARVGLGIATPRGGRGMRWVTVFAGGC